MKLSVRKIGVAVIIWGIFILLSQMNILRGDVEVLAIAMFLAFGYIFMGPKRYGSIGFLIPASILGMVYFTENYLLVWLPGNDTMLMTLAIGLAFLFVFLLHTRRFDVRVEKYWPLIVGCAIMVLGVAEGIITYFSLSWMHQYYNLIIALGLIILGAFLIVYTGKEKRRK